MRNALTTPIALVVTSVLVALLSGLPSSNASAWQTTTAGPDCANTLSVESGTIARISDGDTVVLADDRRVRLIGINTLELNDPKRTHQQAAVRAKDALSELLPTNEPVLLFVGEDSHDRHNRLLAHVVRQSDKLAVASMLLEQGHAMQSAVAPNTRCADFFTAVERKARQLKLGVWQNVESLNTSAASIGKKSRGFKLITGTVTNVRDNPNQIAFTLDDRMTVMVRTELIDLFKTNHPLQTLLGKKVEVRGWLNRKKNNTQLWLQHLSNLQFVGE